MSNIKRFMTASLMALFAFSAIAGNSGKELAAGKKDIVDTAHNAGGFSTLIKALKAADLVPTLRSEGPFTVFAPTDAAFAKLPAGTLDDLLKPENKSELVNLLNYHVHSGLLKNDQIFGMKSVNSVEGNDVAITTGDKHIILNGKSKITQSNVETSNGIIHVVDTVLMPPMK